MTYIPTKEELESLWFTQLLTNYFIIPLGDKILSKKKVILMWKSFYIEDVDEDDEETYYP